MSHSYPDSFVQITLVASRELVNLKTVLNVTFYSNSV